MEGRDSIRRLPSELDTEGLDQAMEHLVIALRRRLPGE